MAKFAIIETGGKQYRVSNGTKLKIEKLPGDAGGAVHFEKVLLVAEGDAVQIGTPYVAGVKVEGKIAGAGRHDKRIIFKYSSKSRFRRKKGHRQHFTEVEITKV